jgi:D-glycero-alpha-D-manno-heptose-7-phosphate kinase
LQVPEEVGHGTGEVQQSPCPLQAALEPARWKELTRGLRLPFCDAGEDTTHANSRELMSDKAREVVTRAPTRIDLGGGWTDVPPYCDREGGFVCNIAINRYATARVTGDGRLRPSVSDNGKLVAAALRRAHLEDVRVTLENDFPVGAGLGGSSAASAAVLGALSVWRGEGWDRTEVAEEGRRIEVEELGVAGGRQDHYAATHGGALALTFNTTVGVRQIPLTEKTQRELVDRAVLVYTGESRISGDTITAVLGAYEAGERRVVNALARMRDLAREMAGRLEASDLDAVGALLSEHWTFQRSLDPSIPTPRIDEIITRSRSAGALGGKAMGASGGGCVLLIARVGSAEAVREAVRPLGEVLEFDIDHEGLCVVRGAA